MIRWIGAVRLRKMVAVGLVADRAGPIAEIVICPGPGVVDQNVDLPRASTPAEQRTRRSAGCDKVGLDHFEPIARASSPAARGCGPGRSRSRRPPCSCRDQLLRRSRRVPPVTSTVLPRRLHRRSPLECFDDATSRSGCGIAI